MKCEHVTSLGKYHFFLVIYSFIGINLLSTSLLNVNIATYYTNSLSYGYSSPQSSSSFPVLNLVTLRYVTDCSGIGDILVLTTA